MNISEQMLEQERIENQLEISQDIVKMIKQWSEVFEAPIQSNKSIPSSFRENICYKLIAEELEELFEAQNEKNLEDIQDALGDLLWVVVRAMMEYGINPLATIQSIYKSNMSKLDDSLEDAILTKSEYEKKGVQTYYEKTKNNKYVTKRTLDDKILKSHKFVKPNFNN